MPHGRSRIVAKLFVTDLEQSFWSDPSHLFVQSCHHANHLVANIVHESERVVRRGEGIDANREWWCQAEAVVGFWHAWERTGEAAFAEAAERVWGFIRRRVVDAEGGEWFWRVFPDGTVDRAEPKVSAWKGPYHNVRMCLEMMRRIDG